MIKKYGLFIAWMISLLGMLTTLFMSYQLGYPVCTLCWYQRIALYPLVVILGVATFTNDVRGGVRYALAFPVIGFIFACYQYLEQMIPGFAPLALCTQSGPQCNQTHILWFGFITIPMLSMLINFAIMTLLILVKNCYANK